MFISCLLPNSTQVMFISCLSQLLQHTTVKPQFLFLIFMNFPRPMSNSPSFPGFQCVWSPWTRNHSRRRKPPPVNASQTCTASFQCQRKWKQIPRSRFRSPTKSNWLYVPSRPFPEISQKLACNFRVILLTYKPNPRQKHNQLGRDNETELYIVQPASSRRHRRSRSLYTWDPALRPLLAHHLSHTQLCLNVLHSHRLSLHMFSKLFALTVLLFLIFHLV